MTPPKIPADIGERPAKLESVSFRTNLFGAVLLRILKEFPNQALTVVEIINILQNQNPPLASTDEAAVYVSLKKLQRDRLLLLTTEKRPAKFQITSLGEQYLAQELKNLQNIFDLLK